MCTNASTASAPSPEVVATKIKGLLSLIPAKGRFTLPACSAHTCGPQVHCHLDHVPTWLGKRVDTVLAPVRSKDVQCVSSIWIFFWITQRYRRLPATKKALTWSWRCEFMQSDIEPQLCLRARWKSFCKPLYRSCRTEQTVSCQTVCLQSQPTHQVQAVRNDASHLHTAVPCVYEWTRVADRL